ncbi:MAG: hypothetical protein A2284_05845 [Deltaproteobacteria bacterium RIFOXYA12_FULL_61_11]|nr:MAG: hypothetical protein A2284_05845 [Deltaproteobacteria bacterium RIFOXYA12_FULL_61_11]
MDTAIRRTGWQLAVLALFFHGCAAPGQNERVRTPLPGPASQPGLHLPPTDPLTTDPTTEPQDPSGAGVTAVQDEPPPLTVLAAPEEPAQPQATPAVVQPEDDGRLNPGWIGGSCAGHGECLYDKKHCYTAAEGFPNGMCSKSCKDACPQGEGADLVPVKCILPSAFMAFDQGLCFAECARNLYPDNDGCRPGYFCSPQPKASSKATTLEVCIPRGLTEAGQQGGADPIDPPAPIAAEPDWQTLGAEAWRPLCVKYFSERPGRPDDIEYCVDKINAESRGNPRAVSPEGCCCGLFQHHRLYWADRATKAGFPGADCFDGEANIAAAAVGYFEEAR